MSQQEFEPQQSPDKEIYQPQYPYSWSNQGQEGMPRDEPPGSYGEYRDQQNAQAGQPQVPWWARPQPQQNGPFIFAAIIALAILITFIIGALGIAGVIIGALAHILGFIIGAIIALIIFVTLLTLLILNLIWRSLGRIFGPPRRSSRSSRGSRRGPW
jgi:hypothetical protein